MVWWRNFALNIQQKVMLIGQYLADSSDTIVTGKLVKGYLIN